MVDESAEDAISISLAMMADGERRDADDAEVRAWRERRRVRCALLIAINVA